MSQLIFLSIYQNFKNSSRIFSLTITSLFLLSTSYGCVQKAPEEIQLEIKNIQSENSNNIYKISGDTNLPDSSQITIEAVRYLRPTQGQAEILSNSDTDPKRSILARQVVQVKQGKWQANLRLSRVAPDGSFQEVWQANQSLLGLAPENGVKFIAIFDPANQWQQSKQQKLEQANLPQIPLEGKLVRFTNEGEKYLQTSQTLLIPLPGGKTTPPRPQPSDVNGGWGNRYQLPPKSVVAQTNFISPNTSRTTNASLSSAEFLR